MFRNQIHKKIEILQYISGKRDIASSTPLEMGIFAKENGKGMWFSEDDHTPPTEPREDDSKGPPSLKLVK